MYTFIMLCTLNILQFCLSIIPNEAGKKLTKYQINENKEKSRVRY